MNNTIWITILGFYTLLIVGGIYYYEDSLRNFEIAIEDYKRALNLSKNTDHYTYLQLENKKLKQDMIYLSHANDHLQAENKSLRKDNNELLNGGEIQYESHTYNNNTYNSSRHNKIIEL